MMAQSHATLMSPQSQPTMQPLQDSCREKAKIAAIVDIVISTLGALFFFCGTGFCFYAVDHLPFGTGLNYLLLFMFVVAFLVHGGAIWMDASLINAVKPTTPPDQVLMVAKNREINYGCFLIFIVIFGCIFFVKKYLWIFGVVIIIFGFIRVPLLYLVHTFIQELQRVGDGAPTAGGNAMANTNSQYQQQPEDWKGQP